MQELKNTSLKRLLSQAKEKVIKYGEKRDCPRGAVLSLKGMKLAWENPLEDKDAYFYWNKKSADWYYQIFVAKKKANKPEALPNKGDWLYPYKYAHRSRFYDHGWGYLSLLVSLFKKLAIKPEKFGRSKKYFYESLALLGDYLHLQIVLSLLYAMSFQVKAFLKKEKELKEWLPKIRIDTLSSVIGEIARNPNSRRAVTPSFVYPLTDMKLKPFYGLPPYQLFQLLPGEKDSPLYSFHYHRSLDVEGGAQLDFIHDLNWLQEASLITGRKIGGITIAIGDFHIYPEAMEKVKQNITDWLAFVTDGYPAQTGEAKGLLRTIDFYRNNARLLFKCLS